ncbi:MAG: EF-Tu/IF-2/RF-3 family GTPase [candidate division WOR-3 bacterium]|nr:EF-Tu/IF-2/RF-3 family GTPase [candidate division WOR-3 bacterium]
MEKEIGKVEDYFAHIGVVALRITNGTLKIGDTIHIKGAITDFAQTVESMEIEHRKVQEARVGDSVGIKVKERVRRHDRIYKVTE